ncbi:NAD(P)/FAD-dependent oxidoreductase [Streptomyces sp. NBC_00568]|uniref:FAD-dependent oxidoreductase n=1 Tax=Streptomyces sp. NBC_00568 TaxID=2975779 RepID=UPI0022564DF6|nr:FAD-dependent monooxygenase [Streptomyces sp. NBC_00568]MCX4993648.1 FAD-dependent oxidoreductase [Streptomyces sp. NBC_00568]
MTHTVIVGAGPVGLFTALLLAAEGQQVTVLESDPAKWSQEDSPTRGAPRPGAPHSNHPHLLLPAGLDILECEMPDFTAALLAGGGQRYNMVAGAWNVGAVGPQRTQDSDFDTVAMSRFTLEHVLRDRVRQTPRIALHYGLGVTGFLSAEVGMAGRRFITGVITADGAQWKADLVVDASGRNTRLPELLAEMGLAPLKRFGSRGFRHYTRSFRSRGGVQPVQRTWHLTHHNSLSLLTTPADEGTWSVSLVTSSRDQALRALADSDLWTRTVALLPGMHEWLDGEPTTDVQEMVSSGSVRRSIISRGKPIASGLVLIGDAWATTNDQFGVGLTMGAAQAVLLRNAVWKVGATDVGELAAAYEADSQELIAPVWNRSIAWERHRLAEIDAQMTGHAYVTHDTQWSLWSEVASSQLQDPEVFRAQAAIDSLLTSPAEGFLSLEAAQRLRSLKRDQPYRAEQGPSRSALLSALRLPTGGHPLVPGQDLCGVPSMFGVGVGPR